MSGPRQFAAHGRLAASIAAVSVAMVILPGAGGSASAIAAPAQPLARATLSMLDTTYGDGHDPLYFQVLGQGFRPGEWVTVQASIVASSPNPLGGAQLGPVQVTANDYGQIAATIDGDGYQGTASGFVIRAQGDEHAASIVDLAIGGASTQAAGAN